MSALGRSPLRLDSGLKLCLALACGLCAKSAQAASFAEIPEECGSSSEIERELQRRVGHSEALDATRVTLTRELSGYRLIVEVGSERREIHDANCHELLRAAVVVALALLEPQREAGPVASELSPAPTAKSPASSAPQLALGAGVGVHWGTVPQPTLLLELDGQLSWARWGVAAGLRYLAPTSVQDEAKHGARVGGVGTYLAGTFEPWSQLHGRLGLSLYRLSGTGLGSVERTQDSAWEVAPLVAASFTPYERPPFWASLGAEGQLNLLRSSFQIRNYGAVFQVPWVSGSAFARAGVVW